MPCFFAKVYNCELKTVKSLQIVHIHFIFQDEEKPSKEVSIRPFSHITTTVPLSILTDDLNLPTSKIPGELYPYIR